MTESTGISWRQPRLAVAITLLLFLAGCQTTSRSDLRTQFAQGDLDAAEAITSRLLEKPKSDSNVVRLDQAMLHLLDGRPTEAEQDLRFVRDQFDYLQQRSVAEDVASLGTDDNRRAYSGAEYERVLIRVFLSLSGLFSGSGDAPAYALQAINEQQQSDSTTKVAMAPYLRAALLEERYTESAEVQRSRLQVVSWEPGFQPGRVDLARAASANHSQRGHGVLYVVALVGQGPRKVQESARPTSDALLIADRILSQTGKYSLPPTVAPVPIGRVVRQQSGPTTIQVVGRDRVLGHTETVTDIGRLAEQQFAATRSDIIGRAIVRRIVKKGAVVAMKKEFGVDRNDAADIALTLGGIAWEATEKADLRCWDLLPDRIQVLRLELPAGQHPVALQPMVNQTPGEATESITVPISDGRTTWMLAAFPRLELVGEVLNGTVGISHSPSVGNAETRRPTVSRD